MLIPIVVFFFSFSLKFLVQLGRGWLEWDRTDRTDQSDRRGKFYLSIKSDWLKDLRVRLGWSVLVGLVW